MDRNKSHVSNRHNKATSAFKKMMQSVNNLTLVAFMIEIWVLQKVMRVIKHLVYSGFSSM